MASGKVHMQFVRLQKVESWYNGAFLRIDVTVC